MIVGSSTRGEEHGGSRKAAVAGHRHSRDHSFKEYDGTLQGACSLHLLLHETLSKYAFTYQPHLKACEAHCLLAISRQALDQRRSDPLSPASVNSGISSPDARFISRHDGAKRAIIWGLLSCRPSSFRHHCAEISQLIVLSFG